MAWWLVPIILGLGSGGCLSTRKIGAPPDGGEKDTGERLDGDGRVMDQDMFVTDGDGGRLDPDMFFPDAGVPGPPVLLHPVEGATLQPTLPPNPLGAFYSWEDGFLPVGTEVSHYVFCYTTAGMEDIDGPSCPNGQNIENRFVLLDSIETGIEYYWKVKSCFDAEGNECTPFSEIKMFRGGDESMLPFAKWDFNGDLNDSGPNGLHGEAPINAGFAGPVFVRSGDACDGAVVSGLLEGDQIACFDDSDGTYDYVQLTQHIDRLGFGSMDDYAVETRVRRESADGAVDLFRMAGDFTPRPSDPVLTVSLTSAVGLPEFANRIFVERSGIQLYSEEEISLGSFIHFVINHDGDIPESTLGLYAGGVLQDSDVSDNSFSAEEFNFAAIHAVPGCPETCTASSNVLLDSIAIYQRTLAPEEIMNNLCAFQSLTGEESFSSVCLNAAE